MKKIFSILLLFLFVTVSCAQQNLSNCQSSMDFLNDDIDMYAFSFTDRVKEIKILEKNLETATPRETTTTIKLDDNGKITETFLTNARIKMFGRTVYFYDKNNRLVKKVTYNPDGSAVSEDVYGYNANGNLESEIKQSATTKKVISKTEYKYESPKSYLEYSDGKFARRIKLTRDHKCRIVETSLYKENDKLENKLTMSFDEKNNLIEQVVYSPNGMVIQKTKSEYEYDNRGNWIKRNYYEWFYEDGDSPYKLKKVETRTITYLN
jgi:outer membrane lipoprotein-sorting protein